MKTRLIHRRGGFTLIELLVVVSIIAVLAAAGFGVGLKVQNTARKKTAEAAAQAIVQAVNSYYSDNGSMPVPQGVSSTEGGTSFTTNSADGIKILNILAGNEDQVNTRQVKYLTTTEAKGKKGGLVYNQSGREVTGMFDPWGNPYTVVLDTNYEERLEVSLGGSRAKVPLNGRRCAVYSPGQDKKLGTGDDVKTW